MAEAPKKTTDKAAEEDTRPQTWADFVDPRVRFKAEPDTQKIIAALMPCLPRPCRVTAGYLDDADQFWRVSWHWEYLLIHMRSAAALPISAKSKQTIESLCTKLESNSPDPASGYVKINEIGKPHDGSTTEKIRERWKIVVDAKKEFGKILDAEGIRKKYPPEKRWNISVAYITPPGTSQHGNGFAIDIEGKGKHALIDQICTSLGATYTLDEKSHMHVEFKQGVLVGKPPIADNHRNGKWSGFMHSEKNLPEAWFVFTGNRPYGPYDIKQMAKLFDEKRITEAMPIARKGAKSWSKMADDPALKSLLQGANTSGQPQGQGQAQGQAAPKT